jgi:hypothetical protein
MSKEHGVDLLETDMQEIENIVKEGSILSSELITGFETPSELSAYEKGMEHEEKTIVKFIENWNGETNSVIGKLLADKVQAENEKLKDELDELQHKYEVEYRDSGVYQIEVGKLKEALKDIGNSFKPSNLSMWDFVDELRQKAKEAIK